MSIAWLDLDDQERRRKQNWNEVRRPVLDRCIIALAITAVVVASWVLMFGVR